MPDYVWVDGEWVPGHQPKDDEHRAIILSTQIIEGFRDYTHIVGRRPTTPPKPVIPPPIAPVRYDLAWGADTDITWGGNTDIDWRVL